MVSTRRTSARLAAETVPSELSPTGLLLPGQKPSRTRGVARGENTMDATPRSALPLEIIEEVLKLAFLRPTELTPSADPFFLNNTSHLLLVSKGFRQLCLPLFLKSITISRPSHYSTFFDPKNGLFAGEEGTKLWSLVKELSIVVDVEPPLFPQLSSSYRYIVPLEVPSGRNLDVVCLLDSIKLFHPANDEDVLYDLVKQEMQRQTSVPSASSSPPRKKISSNQTAENIEYNAFLERANFFADDVLGNARPSELRLSTQTLDHYPGFSADKDHDGGQEALRIYCSSNWDDEESVASYLAFLIDEVQSKIGSTAYRVYLEEFSTKFLEGMSDLEILRHYPDGASWRDPALWVWIWKLEDGSIHELPPRVAIEVWEFDEDEPEIRRWDMPGSRTQEDD